MSTVYSVQQLLLVQKYIYLLSDFHYEHFCDHLTAIKAELPLQLSQIIRKKLPDFDTPEELCRKIYGKYDNNDRLAFNQLASYTFKLSETLAINYPAYLSHNYTEIQHLINTGKLQQANFLAKTLLEIAEKIEDYTTQIFTLKFLVQQAFLMKQSKQGAVLIKQLDGAIETEQILHRIFSAIRVPLNIAMESQVSEKELNEYKEQFKEWHKHTSAAVRMLSMYAYVYTIYYHEPQKFGDANMMRLIKEVERELNNFGHVVFPFAFDLKSNFSFYKLNAAKLEHDSREGKKEFEELERHSSSVKFWNSYLNIPAIFTMAIQASGYLTAYHHLVHRNDFYRLIPAEDLKQINILASRCGEMLKHTDLEEYYRNDLINLHMLYNGLIILSGGTGIKRGAEGLESMLISYQQVNLAGTADSIFLFLIIAYFSMEDYDACSRTFKRYVRSTKGKTVYAENDAEIKIYYYLSQWLLLKRQQYLNKLKAQYQEIAENKTSATQALAVKEMVSYFKAPVEL